jgi:hypothetical protein
MFNRTRTSRDGAPATDHNATTTFDEVLTELGGPRMPRPDAFGGSDGSEPAADHAAALRATRDAQQQAQEMLTMASQVRGSATEQAEELLQEARDAADRLRAEAARDAERIRQETTDWVATQRARVDAAVAELTAAANHDAEAIRAEAIATAMAEAEETARIYVGEAAARGARDAEATRGRANAMLARVGTVGEEVSTSVRDLSGTLQTALTELRGKLEALDELAAETRQQIRPLETAAPNIAPSPAEPITVATAPTAPGPASPDPLERRELGALFRRSAAREQ